MLEFVVNQAIQVEKIQHADPEISVYVVDDFLANPEVLIDYARHKAYFGKPGDDRRVYPGIQDRLPRPYERAMERIIELVYDVRNPLIQRCLLSLTTLGPKELTAAQKMPHIDSFSDDQYAAVHYLCGEPHGGTVIYRYRPRNIVRLRDDNRAVIGEMLQGIRDHSEEHRGYLVGDTSLFKQEVHIAAKFNRLVLYPSNLLHNAQLSSPESLSPDITRGRLSVASLFKLGLEQS